MKRRKYFTFVCVVSLLFIVLGLLSCQEQTGAVDSALIAPNFTLPDLEGKPYSLSDAQGKVIILDFWATWCPPCRMEIPHFKELYSEYKEKGLVVIGIALDRGGAADVKPFADEVGINYTIVIGDQKVVSDYGGVRGIPTTFVIDRRGQIIEKYVGYRSKEIFEEAIKKLL